MKDYSFTSFEQVRTDLLAGKYTAGELCDYYIHKINTSDHGNAFLEIFEESAKSTSAEIDTGLKLGRAGRLCGAIIAIKDNICYRNHKVGAASKILEGFESVYSATIIERLLAEGAIIIGRTNCDEFAMGSSNENSAYGPVKHPLNHDLVPGGSSGGSAAAVAGGFCMASLGSDTGGSIRQPAAFTGIVGMKPTYGRISRYGLIAFASSFDQIGPFATNVNDTALLYEVMAGRDQMDSTSSHKPFEHFEKSSKNFRFAYLKEVMDSPGLHPDVKKAFSDKLKFLKDSGHEVVGVSFPYLDHMVPCYYVLTTAEASSNLARFDGVHYGRRSAEAHDIPSTYFNSRTEGFGPEVKRRIMLGTFVLSAGYFDSYYSKAQKVRGLIKSATDKILEENDFIISPTTPHPAFKIGAKSNDPIALYLEDIFTVQANLAGNPAISVPMGKTSESLPMGIQITAGSYNEKMLFQGAALLET